MVHIAYTVMACIVMARMVMAYVVMAYMGVSYIAMVNIFGVCTVRPMQSWPGVRSAKAAATPHANALVLLHSTAP